MSVKRLTYFLLFCLLVSGSPIFGQGLNTEFGKHKVQYGDFEWYFYRTSDFEVYYYGGGKNLAHYVLTHAKSNLEEIEKKLDYRFGERMTIIIYNTYSDYKQSNITLVDEKYNTGGHTPIVENKAFVYFDGDHQDFDKRIKSAFAEVLINEYIYGNTIQQRIQNAALISLPVWYYNGLIAYISGDWDLVKQEKLNQGILSEKYEKFSKLNEDESLLFGHSFWEYIENVYGKDAIPNILYQTHLTKNLESGFSFVVGKPFPILYKEWYGLNRYQVNSTQFDKYEDVEGFIDLKKVARKGEITHISMDEYGDKVAVVTNLRGKIRVYILDLNTGKKKKIYKDGYKNPDVNKDRNYPLICWNPRRNELTMIYEKKSQPWIVDYNLDEKKFKNRKKLDKLDRVLSMDYNQKGDQLVLSAVRNGNSDIFLYIPRANRTIPITNDIYDDLQPRFVLGSEAIVFSTNRNELKLKRKFFNPEKEFNSSYDIVYYNIKKRDLKLKRVTFTPNINEFMPDVLDSTYISYITEQNNIRNRDFAYLDSIFNRVEAIVTYTDTNQFKSDTFKVFENNLSLLKVKPATYIDTIIKEVEKVFEIDSFSVPFTTFDTSFIKKKAEIARIDTSIIYNDTAYSFTQTNYPSNLIGYEVKNRTNLVLETFYKEDNLIARSVEMPENVKKTVNKRYFETSIEKNYELRRTKLGITNFNLEDEPETPVEEDKEEVETERDSFAYYFLTPYNYEQFLDKKKVVDSGNIATISDNDIIESPDTDPEYIKERKKPEYTRSKFGSSSIYFLNFTPDQLVTQFDNSFMFTPYLPYNGKEPIQPFFRVTNAFFMLGINDVFKDYRINGGFRLMGNLKGAEYVMSLENLKKRLDKRIIFYRIGQTTEDNYNKSRQLTHEIRTQFKYPFRELDAIKLDLFFREDRYIALSSEENSLLEPDLVTRFTGFKLEYVYDNTINLATNLYDGTRYKIYFENFRNITRLQNEFFVVGGDFRNYIKIHKNIIWANRFAAASSIGNSKVVYFLGGVDNWIFPQFNYDIQVDPEENYVYKTLAANMRGFRQNIRNGHSYALFSSELRFPVIKYFINRPMKSAFLENFQMVGFTDIGTAWTGDSPYSENNALNKRIINNNPLQITVTTVGEPVVVGYGLGVRTMLFGYFVKFDYAWGSEGGEVFNRVAYVSFGLDF
jgi:hypothetical protein